MTRHVAMVCVPLTDITERRTARLVEALGVVEVLGKPCRVGWTGRHVEFSTHGRTLEISIEGLVETARVLIEMDLKGDLARRVRAARDVEPGENIATH